jgi:hypothetical protein
MHPKATKPTTMPTIAPTLNLLPLLLVVIVPLLLVVIIATVGFVSRFSNLYINLLRSKIKNFKTLN